jgi:hypothetical protein
MRHLQRALVQLLVVEQDSAAVALLIAVVAVLPIAAEATADTLAPHARLALRRLESEERSKNGALFYFCLMARLARVHFTIIPA